MLFTAATAMCLPRLLPLRVLLFILRNGQFLDCDNQETYAFFMDLFERHSFRFSQLHEWPERHAKPLAQ